MAKALNVSKPVVSRALDSLTALGLVARVPDGEDGRSVLVAPGAKSEGFIKTLSKALVL